ncbi:MULTISPECIES: hypothetical protein [unclassified Streptomyces]|nr:MULTISPECIES: hypothetical protein [unclassified Streptomyces]
MLQHDTKSSGPGDAARQVAQPPADTVELGVYAADSAAAGTAL